MKRVILSMLSGLIIVWAYPAHSATVNILSNPGFETGSISPWIVTPPGFGYPSEEWNVTSDEAHTGNYSVTSVGISVLSQNIPEIPTSDILEFSFWLMQPEAVVFQVMFYYTDYFSSCLVWPVTSGWEYFDVKGNLAPGEVLKGFAINGYEGGGGGEDRSYVDDVTLEVVPIPGAIWLLGSGLVGLAGVRRKFRK